MWLSFSLRMPQFRVASYLVFAVMAIRLLFFDTWMHFAVYQPVLNERFLAFFVSIAALYLAAHFLRQQRQLLH